MKVTSNAVLIKDGKILIGKRPKDKKSYAGLWDVIGGHLEGSETPEEAVRREVKEEIGVTITKFRLFDVMKNDTDPTSK
jgi:8-oxo-dGTP diphosphatase